MRLAIDPRRPPPSTASIDKARRASEEAEASRAKANRVNGMLAGAFAGVGIATFWLGAFLMPDDMPVLWKVVTALLVLACVAGVFHTLRQGDRNAEPVAHLYAPMDPSHHHDLVAICVRDQLVEQYRLQVVEQGRPITKLEYLALKAWDANRKRRELEEFVARRERRLETQRRSKGTFGEKNG